MYGSVPRAVIIFCMIVSVVGEIGVPGMNENEGKLIYLYKENAFKEKKDLHTSLFG